MRPSFRALSAGAAACLALPLLALPAGAASPSADPAAAPLAGSRAAWATPAAATGDTPGDALLDLTLDIRLRDAAGAEAYAAAVSDPGSAQHGRFLSPEQFKARFAATDATVARVRAFLVAQGVQVTDASPVNRYLAVTVSAAKAEQLFGVQLKQYDKGGRKLQANDGEVTLPADIASVVTAVQGLTRAPLRKDSPAPPSPAFVNSGPCSTYYGEKIATHTPEVDGKHLPYAPCGYVPSQLRSAYDVQELQSSPAKIDGRGTTVAVVDAYNSPTILTDANTYAARHGEPVFAEGQFSQLRPKKYTEGYGYKDPVYGEDACGEQGWYGEETLDVEAVHGMAPGADVLFSGAASCFDNDIDTAVRRVVDGHLASIISNSYGDAGEDLDPASINAEHTTFVQAAIEGIGVYFSSGDSGDEQADLKVRTVDYPASDPWVTAVGGTSLAIGADGKRQFETGWSTGRSVLHRKAYWQPSFPGLFQYGGGGGVSTVFAQPSYQQGVVPGSISKYFGKDAAIGGRTPGRAVPDISAIGDPNTGMLVGQTQTFPDGKVRYSEYRIGGTSLACPVIAGIMALGDQVDGRPRGFANYFIYSQNGKATLHDSADTPKPGTATTGVVRVDFVNGVDAAKGTTTTLRSINLRQSIFVRPGYDDVTGVGQPIGAPFLLASAGSAAPGSPAAAAQGTPQH